MRLKLIIAFCVITSNFSVLADTIEGQITTLWVNHKVWFSLDTTPPVSELKVDCNTTRRFVVDATTDKGRAIYSAVLMAKSMNLKIRVVGSGNCSLHGDSEGVSYINTL